MIGLAKVDAQFISSSAARKPNPTHYRSKSYVTRRRHKRAKDVRWWCVVDCLRYISNRTREDKTQTRPQHPRSLGAGGSASPRLRPTCPTCWFKIACTIPSMYHINKKILRSSGIKTESVLEMAKGYPPGLRLLYSSGFERQPSRFDGMHALDR
jgi:hypothetical protein